jgi:hypothetical protein
VMGGPAPQGKGAGSLRERLIVSASTHAPVPYLRETKAPPFFLLCLWQTTYHSQF